MKNKVILKRRLRSRIMAGMLTMILCLAASLTVLAETEGGLGEEKRAIFTKKLEYAQKLTPPDVTFTFTFAKLSLNGSTAPEDLAAMPAINNKIIAYSSTDQPTGTSDKGLNQISKTSGDVLSGLTPSWPTTGTYVYEVKETASGFDIKEGETMNYSTATYKLYVVIAYDTEKGGYYVEKTLVEQTTGDNTGKSGADTDDKNYSFYFTNTYTKQGGTLTITKKITGDGSDPIKQFQYTITANDFVTGIAATKYAGTITRVSTSSKELPESVILTADGTSTTTFTLADGEKIVFDKLPVGTTFTVVETGTAGYTASCTGIAEGGPINETAEIGADLSTGSQSVGKTNNVVDYTNNYDKGQIPMGVLSNIVPFLVLLAVAVFAFVAFAVINRRKVKR